MTAIYVREQGAQVRRKGERLVVSKQGNIIDEFPLSNVDQVVLMGNVQLTTQATATLLQKNIDTVFLSIYGKFRGRLQGTGSKNVSLRQEQLNRLADDKTSLKLAKSIVDGKIHNQRVVLQRQANRLRSGATQERGVTVYPRDLGRFEKALQGMIAMRQRLPSAQTLDQVRGYEGKAAVFYFSAVRTLLDKSWGFDRREYYPPPDPFNALLSFTYSLVRKDVEAGVQMVGLDMYLGFFHEINYGRPSLALDLMEEWRPLVADALCLEMINRGALVPDQFQFNRNPKRPVELGEAGVQRVLHGYGGRLENQIHHPLAGGPSGGRVSIKVAISLQARQLARFLTGKAEAYTPMMIK